MISFLLKAMLKLEFQLKSLVLILVVSKVISKPLLRNFPTFKVAEEKPELADISASSNKSLVTHRPLSEKRPKWFMPWNLKNMLPKMKF